MPLALIIGGGICGLASAHALKKAGVDFLLFERANELREVGAGLTLWSNGIKALSKISLAEAAIAAGQKCKHFEFITQRGRSLGQVDINALSSLAGNPSISIHRMRLMQVLENQIDYSQVHLAHEFESFVQTENGITAKFTNGSSYSGDFILGCDGFHSKLRQWMHPHTAQKYAGYTCWRGVCAVPPNLVPPGGVLHYLGKGSQIGLLDVGQQQLCWYVTANAKEGSQNFGEERKHAVLESVKDYPEAVRSAIELTKAEAVLLNDIYDRDPVMKWASERVLLMGDAAHPTTPNLGQGACMAIEDAVVLGECFASSSNYADAFSKFTSMRQARTARIVLSSRKIGFVSQLENPLARMFRDESIKLSVQFNALSDLTYALTGF